MYRENGWKIGTVGKAFDGVEVKVIDADPLTGIGEVPRRLWTKVMLVTFEVSLAISGLLSGKECHDGLPQPARKDKGSH